MKSCICLVVTLMALLITQSHASAALVINSVVTSVDNSNPLTSTVNVSLYGLYRNDASPPPENVSTFGVTVTINDVTPISITSAANAPVSSQWSAFTSVLAPTVSLASKTVTFQAYNSPDGTFAPINGTTVGASTLIGSFSFSVNKTTSSQAFTTTASAATAFGAGGPPTSVGSGFLRFNNVLVYEGVTTNFNADPTNINNPLLGSGTITPTAVPEPSSLALLGLVSAGGYIARRRRAAKVS